MRFLLMLAVIALAGCATREPAPGGGAAARTVKITPVGSHDGEFCAFDRALIFEDPDGTRILYDVGRTVRGASDARLGKIDGVLLSHVHGDHIGDSHQASANAGTCAAPDISVRLQPNDWAPRGADQRTP